MNEERGDKIEVLNMPFEVENIPEEKSLFGNADNKELVAQPGKVCLLPDHRALRLLLRFEALFKMFQKKEEALPLQKGKGRLHEGREEPQGPAAIPAGDQTQPAIAEAFKDKALVGSIIREWVKENA